MVIRFKALLLHPSCLPQCPMNSSLLPTHVQLSADFLVCMTSVEASPPPYEVSVTLPLSAPQPQPCQSVKPTARHSPHRGFVLHSRHYQWSFSFRNVVLVTTHICLVSIMPPVVACCGFSSGALWSGIVLVLHMREWAHAGNDLARAMHITAGIRSGRKGQVPHPGQ